MAAPDSGNSSVDAGLPADGSATAPAKPHARDLSAPTAQHTLRPALRGHAAADDGTRIYYEAFSPSRDWAGPPQTDQRQVVLLIMGLGTTGRLWAPVVRELMANGFPVVTMDNRGCGRSETPLWSFTTRQMADDAIVVLDHLGVARAHVSGGSLGGMVAQELALEYPQRVISLVLACTTGGFPRVDLYPRMGMARLWRFIRIVNPVGDRDERIRDFLRWSCTEEFAAECHPGTEAWETVAAMFDDPISRRGSALQILAALRHSSWSRLPGMATPVQIHHGTRDTVIPLAAGRELARQMPNAELIVHTGAGHALVFDSLGLAKETIPPFLARCEGVQAGETIHLNA
jgi:3-oxoadipate enol-lactonase